MGQAARDWCEALLADGTTAEQNDNPSVQQSVQWGKYRGGLGIEIIDELKALLDTNRSYATNYLIDLDHAVIVEVEASSAVRQAEVTAAKTMIARAHDRFDLQPARLAADTGYGSAEMLNWLVSEKNIEPHIPVFDKSKRPDGTFSRDDFTYDHERDIYVCPGGKNLTTRGTL